MESQNTASVEKTSPPVVNPAASSCRKKKTEGASFISDVREHIDEFIHASMDEHKTCFKKTIQKVSQCLPNYTNFPSAKYIRCLK